MLLVCQNFTRLAHYNLVDTILQTMKKALKLSSFFSALEYGFLYAH
jgi:hypothetical protein